MANRGLNSVVLMGHLGGDAKRINSQRGFGCNFNLATTRRYKKSDGQWTEETAWIRCSFWNSENVFEFLKQGRQVVIEGHLTNFPYQDSGGKDLRLMEVAVDALILTDYRSKNAAPGEQESDQPPAQAQAQGESPEMLKAKEYVKQQGEALMAEIEERERQLEKRIAALDAGLEVEAAPGHRRRAAPAQAPKKRAAAGPRGRR